MILVVKSILIFLIFFHQHLNSQNIETIGTQESFKTKIWEDLRKASSTSPTSFHITTDRNWYFTGDEIWFKVYLLTNGLPETRSGVLYVDLSDSTGHVLIKKKLLISDFGTSYGVIHLLEDHKSGWYSLRVQTEWNRNFNHGFEKPIYVNARGNLPPDISITKIVSEKERVCLFPEGGNFVAGLQNRFAVRTVNENGDPEPGQLFVIDTISKDTLTKFKTSSNGLGQFTLTSNQSQNIIVLANWPNGKVSKHSLPGMILNGITLQTSLVSEKLYYKIESTRDFIFEGDMILLTAVMHNEIIFSKLFRKANETFHFSSYIPVNSFPAGIISLRLYSSTGRLVAMRNVYNHKERQTITDSKLIRFEPKVKNEITISLPDTLFGTYSVGITDADLIRPDIIDLYTKEENILNENPFTLFQLYQSLGKEIDLYLLTLHDNFKQAAAIDSISEIKFNHEAGINIAGKIEYERPGYQISGSVINFFPKNLAYGNFILTDTLDSKGNFRLQNLLVPDSTVLYWKINGFDKKNENKLKLTLNESWFDSLRLRPTLFKEKNLIKKEDAKSTTQTVLNKYYETDSLYNVKSKTLKEVTVFSTKKNRVEELEQKYAGASLFAGKLGFASTYDLEEEKGFYFSVFTYLQTRVTGLKVLGNFDNPLLIYRNPMTLKGDQVTNVAIFLNDTKVEARDVAAIPVSEIGYLKIFRAPFANQLALEDQGPDSQPISLVITIYLRKDARKPETTTDPFFLRSFAVNGYSLPPQFPATEYSKNFASEAIPDKRVTLYWNPELAFINGRANIVFYNNDFSKKYLIQIEGINELGEAVCFRQIIER